MAESTTGKTRVAFVGLGRMGSAMAASISRVGYPLVVWNRSPEKAAALLASGAMAAESPAAAAAAAGVVISSVSDDVSARAVILEQNGILSGMRPEAIHIGTSTISPKLSDELGEIHAKAGCHYIAGPVVGRVPAAEAAQLVTLLAGESRWIELARPVIAAYASLIFTVGERPAQALTAKLVANFLGASAMDLIGQTVSWAERSGMSPVFVSRLLTGFFAYPATREYVTKITNRDFDDVGFTVSGGLKDITLMIDAARDVQLSLSSAEALHTKLELAIANGWRDKDWSCFTDIDRGLERVLK